MKFNDRVLYISDLDGTLLNSKAQLSDYTKSALNRMIAGGLNVSAATGRTPASVLKIVSGIEWTLPISMMNGVLLYDFDSSRYTRALTMDSKAASHALAVFKRCKADGLLYRFVDDGLRTYYDSSASESLRESIERRILRFDEVFIETDVLSADGPGDAVYLTWHASFDSVKSAYDMLSDIPGAALALTKDVYNPGKWLLEVFDRRASKGNAVEYFKEAYGFERVVGFGDNLNDLPLFEACDISVAPENALDEVKAAADHICETNDRDGVVKWIEAHVRE